MRVLVFCFLLMTLHFCAQSPKATKTVAYVIGTNPVEVDDNIGVVVLSYPPKNIEVTVPTDIYNHLRLDTFNLRKYYDIRAANLKRE